MNLRILVRIQASQQFRDRLAVGRLPLKQTSVVRIHVSERVHSIMDVRQSSKLSGLGSTPSVPTLDGSKEVMRSAVNRNTEGSNPSRPAMSQPKDAI